MAVVKLNELSKRYTAAAAPAVDNADLTIEDGEFMVFLGPSGCGKSTTLRMIAGLESITGGELTIDGARMNEVPAKDRDIAMVFQSYALYPHMTVFENLAFGLRRRGFDKTEIGERVAKAAETLGLSEYLDRKPHALSGGQRQRVALGRAIVRHPKVFLLDEPLSNLDAALRVSTRAELIRQHRQLRTTMIYVTHDQIEAMTMGTRICIMNGGRIVQVGKPLEVYENPADTFVARFLGSPGMNLVPLTVRRAAGGHAVKFGGTDLAIPMPDIADQDVILGIRPEDISEDGSPGTVSFEGIVDTVEPLGADTLLLFRVAEHDAVLTARVDRSFQADPGQSVTLHINTPGIRLFDSRTKAAISRTEPEDA